MIMSLKSQFLYHAAIVYVNSVFLIKICSIETDKSSLEINNEAVSTIKMIKSSLTGLFDELEKRATNEINSFKSWIHLFFI